ncbi:MAG: sugar phosphate isomerase/epimerase, partial [Burkholderiales bacterium]|nr:sugar phosphate isomerase/epimerase [Opitutaceae bacterium]
MPSLRFGFSTLGCPDLDIAAVRALAAKHRSRFIEIRTLGGSTDFPAQLARFPGGAPAVRDFLLEADVRVALVASSFCIAQAPESARSALIAEAEAGEALGAKWLRVFGGGDWGAPLTAERAATASAHRAWWSELRAARGWTIDLLLEIHDAFSGTPQILEFFDKTGGPMPLLWDTHHTWKIAGETAAFTWAALGTHVRHVHVKDSVAASEAWDRLPYQYVAPGHGEFSTAATFSLLATAGFTGVASLEWEKQWHPSLAVLDAVLPDWNAATAAF